MFDVGFWELALIGVIALIVVGPDRLPGMARTVGFWIGRARRYVDQVRRDVEREIHAEELRNAIHGKGLDDLYEAVDETRNAVREIEQDFQGTGGKGEETEAGTGTTGTAAAGTGSGQESGKKPADAPGEAPAQAAEGTLEKLGTPAGAEEAPVAAEAPAVSGSEAASGERAASWTDGIGDAVEAPAGDVPATSSAVDAEPGPRRDERRENHG